MLGIQYIFNMMTVVGAWRRSIDEEILGAKRWRCGFQLIELRMVIAALGILFALIAPSLTTARMKAKRVKCGQILKSIYVVTMTESMDGADRAPGVSFFRGKEAFRCPTFQLRGSRQQEYERTWRAHAGGYHFDSYFYAPVDSDSDRLAAIATIAEFQNEFPKRANETELVSDETLQHDIGYIRQLKRGEFPKNREPPPFMRNALLLDGTVRWTEVR